MHTRILAAHMRMGYPYAYAWATHTRVGQNSCFAHTVRMSAHNYVYRYVGPYKYIATAMT